MEAIGEDASKLFNIVRKYGEIDKELKAIFAKNELTNEEVLLVVSIIAEEYMKKQEKEEKKKFAIEPEKVSR